MSERTRNEAGIAATIERLIERFGERVSTSASMREQHGHTLTWIANQAPDAVVFAKSEAEVQEIVRIAAANDCPLVPFGAGTSLEGHLNAPYGGISVDVSAMDAIVAVHPDDLDVVVQPGIRRKALNEQLRDTGLFFPIDPGADATLGGMAATRASGTNAVRYGTMKDNVLALRAVTATGEVVTTSRRAKKSSTGYDLTRLFVGSEGTLGIITAAVLEMVPRPRTFGTAFVAVEDPAGAVRLLEQGKATFGKALTGFELMPRIGIDLVVKHLPGARDPITDKYDWYVLVEISSAEDEGVGEALEAWLGTAMEDGIVLDAVIAGSLDQRAQLWKIREGMSEVQGIEGGSIKHDVSVPIASVPEVIAEGIRVAEALIPGIRPVPFGHLGDGNIHFNFSQPVGADKAAYIAQWDALNRVVHAVVLEHGGSVSAEHGIGALKRHLLAEVKDPVAMEVMRSVKSTLDPNGTLNPGKVL